MIVAKLTYDEMLRRHPVEVTAMVAKIRKGKSKVRDEDPAKFEWVYDACVRIEGAGTLADILGGDAARREAKFDAMSIDDKVADHLRRMSCGIVARLDRCVVRSDVVVPNPPEAEHNAREGYERLAAEKARYAALTPAERDAELQEAVKALGSRGLGMIAIR